MVPSPMASAAGRAGGPLAPGPEDVGTVTALSITRLERALRQDARQPSRLQLLKKIDQADDEEDHDHGTALSLAPAQTGEVGGAGTRQPRKPGSMPKEATHSHRLDD